MKKNILFDMFISALIGMFVGLLFMVFSYAGDKYTVKIIIAIFQSALIGIVIGSISEYMIFPMTRGVNKYATFLILFLVNAVLTIFFSWMMGVRKWYYLLMMVTVVEILAIGFYYFQLAYKNNLNKKLKERKSEILDKEVENETTI